MQSVRIEFPLKRPVDASEFTELEDHLATALRVAKAGHVDGNEIGGRSWTIFMYGKSADALFAAIQPVLKSCSRSEGATVTKQFGGPNAEERTRVLWRGRFRITQRPRKPGRRPRVGDVLEFDCKGGVGRAQAIHKETEGQMNGLWVVRVFRHVRPHDKHPSREEELCRTWVVLGPCVAAGLMRVVESCELPPRRRLPRLAIVNPALIRSAVELDCSVDGEEIWERMG